MKLKKITASVTAVILLLLNTPTTVITTHADEPMRDISTITHLFFEKRNQEYIREE